MVGRSLDTRLSSSRIIVVLFLTLSLLLSVSCGSETNESGYADTSKKGRKSADANSQQKDSSAIPSAGSVSKRTTRTSNNTASTPRSETQSDQSIKQELMSHIVYFASDELEGRLAGSSGELLAARYIANLFQSWGLSSPKEFTEKYFQEFDFQSSPTRNVIGVLEGDPNSDVIIVSAHHDHLGIGSEGIFHGADDNASGLAILLYLAKNLAKIQSQLSSTIVFISFSAEEFSLTGSKFYVDNPLYPLTKTSLVLNFDMVGHYKTGGLNFIRSSNLNPTLSTTLDMYCKQFSLRCKHLFDSFVESDHTSFARVSVPALLVHTGTHAYYHTPDDIALKIDSEGMVKIAKISLEIIKSLSM